MRNESAGSFGLAMGPVLLSAVLFSCSSGSDSSSVSVVDASGSWSLVTTSARQLDTMGGICLSGSGSLSISNASISGNFTGNGALNEISGTVETSGAVVAQFTRDGDTIGNVLGTFSNLAGSGTWADVFGCSGDWTATR